MASYTDNIPTFNPYVQTLPVDEMVKVGMYKQQKYDEGIQKIQTNIDNIAGLDVIRPVDKAYLQSKLNQLGNNLTTVAAGDFSNFQLVNSVNGMTNQISKDPNVVNAITSAKTYRKGLEEMDTANKAGKGSASHDWLFKTEASNWLNNQDVNTTFNGGYKQYSNYAKNAQEVIKGLVKNETGQDVAIEYDKYGNMVVLDAMTRTKISGITPERIKSALMVGLSPNDFQSMQIDGRYNYANSNPEQFVGDINKSYKTDYDNLKKLRDMTANAVDTTKSASEKYQLQQQLDSLDKSLKGVQEEYDSVTKTFLQGDTESAKARYFSTKWMNNFSQTFASKEAIQSYEASPFQQVKQYKETKALEYKKWLAEYNQRNAFHSDDQYWKSRDDARAERKDKREAAAAAGYGGLGFSVPQDELPDVDLKTINDKIDSDEKIINSSDAAIMKQFKKEGNEQWLNQQLAAWQKNPGSVDPLLAAHFKDTETTRRDIAANTSMIAQIAAAADAKYGPINNYIPADSKSLTLNYANGRVTYTPEDFVNFSQKVSTEYQNIPRILSDPRVAKRVLKGKEYDMWNAWLNNTQGRDMTPNQRELSKNLAYYTSNVVLPYRKVLAEKDDYVAEQVKQRVVAMQGMEYGIPLDNEAQKTTFGNVVQSVADLADSQGGGLANSPDLNTTTLREIAGDIQNANIRVVEATQFAPATYNVTVANKKGTTQTFRLTPEQYQSVFKGKYDPDPAIAGIRHLEAQQIRAGGGTTALDGQKTNIGNAFMGNSLDFINVRHYSVSGNLVTNQSGMSSIRLNISDPKTGEVIVEDFGYPSGGLITKDKVLPATHGLTDQRIFEMINGRKPTAAELKQLQQ